MSISSSELAAVAREILDIGKRQVEKIFQPSEYELVFVFREEKGVRLFINASLNNGTIFLTREKEESPKAPTPFAVMLRKHISGSRLVAIDKSQNDRQIALRFSPAEVRLVCRFFGKGGFILAGSDGKILGLSGFATSPTLRAGVIYPLPLPDKNEEPAVFEKSPSLELELRYKNVTGENEKEKILTAINRELKKLGNLKKNLAADLEKLSDYSDYQKMGDLCKTYFNKLEKGKSEATLTDPETGEEIKIPLKPELSPAENIALIYKKHHKYISGKERLESALADTIEKINSLKSGAGKIEAATSTTEISTLSEKYTTSQKPQPGKPAKKKEPVKSEPFRRFSSSQGFEIYVGKSGAKNDELLRQSNGNDLWFHVRGFPGSHVVMKTSRAKDVPHDAIVEAAKLALKYSTRAKDGKGEIVYTHVKNVKKPKNAPPGKVLVTREKTVSVRLD